MKRRELKAILADTPANTKRSLMAIYDQPVDGESRGSPGHRDYTEKDIRLLEAWNRITDLTGNWSNDDGVALRRRATRMLAAAPCGYVWISGGRVGWSLGPPVHTIKQGATCWPVTTGLD